MVETMAAKEEKKALGISYFSNTKCHCPVCKKEFPKEVMRSGNGRMIAGALTDELHRIFEPSAKFGMVYPLIYDVGVCPNCYTAFFWNDFNGKFDKDITDKLYETYRSRKESVENIFPYFNLKKERSLYDGCAIYMLALMTYDHLPKDFVPTLKQAMLSLRLAWLTEDLHKEVPGHNFDLVSKMFYSKALFFYQQAIVNEPVEKSSSLNYMGPDMDKNYGWDGVVYLSGLLEYKYGQQNDQQLRLQKLSESKTAIARIFGLGKSSKNKPGPLLEHARNLYDQLSKLIKDEDF